jgi:hypothetical protein
VAAFLVGAGPDHYFTTGTWKCSGCGAFEDHWIPELFEPALGDPLGDAAYDPESQVWTRSFSSGTHVTFNAGTSTGTIDWADSGVIDLENSEHGHIVVHIGHP